MWQVFETYLLLRVFLIVVGSLAITMGQRLKKNWCIKHTFDGSKLLRSNNLLENLIRSRTFAIFCSQLNSS